MTPHKQKGVSPPSPFSSPDSSGDSELVDAERNAPRQDACPCYDLVPHPAIEMFAQGQHCSNPDLSVANASHAAKAESGQQLRVAGTYAGR